MDGVRLPHEPGLVEHGPMGRPRDPWWRISGRKYITILVDEERKNEKGRRENPRAQTGTHRTMVHLLSVLPSRVDHKSIGPLNARTFL